MMRLIDVTAVLEVESSIDNGKDIDFTTEMLKEFYGPDLEGKEYAILSHCWGAVKEEVSFKEMSKLLVMGERKRNEIRDRTGYKKIVATCRQAKKDDLTWVWADTCCIDKRSSSELSEAINSMYKWYEKAKLCYVYLHDIVGHPWTDQAKSAAPPRWFSRGWTLQELIAPKVVHFFDQKWERVGDKSQLAATLRDITRIPEPVLVDGLHSMPLCVAQVISWAAGRMTTREEDRAYSLLGLLGVHMPMLYGEGKNAFHRLQLEIMRTSNDQSIFSWGHSRKSGWSGGFLADDPNCFQDCDEVQLLPTDAIKTFFKQSAAGSFKPIPEEQWATFTVTNTGIQIQLLAMDAGNNGLFHLCLACRTPSVEIVTIQLARLDSARFRVFGFPARGYCCGMRLHRYLLPYRGIQYPDMILDLHDETLSHEGFILDRVVPDGVLKDGSVILSKEKDYALAAYVRKRDHTRFVVHFCYFFGRRPSAFAAPYPQDLEVASVRRRALETLCYNSFSGPEAPGRLHQSRQRPGDPRVVLKKSPHGARYTVTIDTCDE
ncbi:heterokaryon incompatibility protein-domain-containing protein [Pisolithus croceorrhizus]|nr:heterokaryon incompatibility protein-domain-containing protein [Pisolithus croceorrhizus]KAI6146972.1 heterokaryon incompatibility protein-domain-containing protein [Pisolithus thermaeus]